MHRDEYITGVKSFSFSPFFNNQLFETTIYISMCVFRKGLPEEIGLVTDSISMQRLISALA